MRFLYSLAIICIMVAFAFPANLMFRRYRLRKLSKKFNLSFQEGSLKIFSSMYGLFHFFHYEERDANHLEGKVGSHDVHIYDKFSFPLGTELAAKTTIIEIDGEANKKEFTLSDQIIMSPFLTPVRRIRKILKGLQ